jgi:hypothetical protein
LASESVYESDQIALYTLPRKAIQALAKGLERRSTWSLTRTEGVLYIEVDGESHTLELARIPWPSAS